MLMFISIYRILMTIIFPILRVTYIKKRIKIGKESRARFNERVAHYVKKRPEGKLYWFHGASVGESVSMLPLIDKLLKEDENLSILVTTGTLTSAEIMEKRLPKRAMHQFVPFDVPRYAKKFLKHFRPDAVLWFESELWPAMLSEIKKNNIPLILVNGRISDSSYETWKKFKFVAKELLGCFSLCLGQSEQDRKRLQYLGAKKVDCVGNLKFAGMPLPIDEIKFEKIKKAVGDRKVFLVSSTHSNEEEQISEHLKELYRFFDDVLIIVAPRHPNRGDEVTSVFRKIGKNVSQRSRDEELKENTEIYVADTIGEMGMWYKLSDICFVGGSLIKHGGQNFVEPARDKTAVIVGPHMHNFNEMMSRARMKNAVIQVGSGADVVDEVVALFKEPNYMKECQDNAYDWAMFEAKVLDGINDAIKKVLK